MRVRPRKWGGFSSFFQTLLRFWAECGIIVVFQGEDGFPRWKPPKSEFLREVAMSEKIEDVKMGKRNKERSDKKSIELFGMGNEEHYEILELLFV